MAARKSTTRKTSTKRVSRKQTAALEHASCAASIIEYFSQVPDPRLQRTQRHNMADILVITIAAVVSGAEDWVSIERFGNQKEEWLRTFLELPNGIPSHDTFGRFFAALDPTAFEAVTARPR